MPIQPLVIQLTDMALDSVRFADYVGEKSQFNSPAIVSHAAIVSNTFKSAPKSPNESEGVFCQLGTEFC